MGFETRINVNGYEIRNVNGNGVMHDYEEIENGIVVENSSVMNGFCSSKVFPQSPSQSSSSSSSSPRRYIEHHVTKMDTLAGVAIRYGVEVADIKKMNGLVTDLQMFALKTLQIPLPGRHPPSLCLSSGHSSPGPSSSNQTLSHHVHSDIFESFQSLRLTPDRKLSPAMCSLRDFYGLNGERNSSRDFYGLNGERNSSRDFYGLNGERNSSGGCEMVFYGKGSATYQEDESFSTSSSLMNPPLSQHRRSRSMANGFKTEEDELANDLNTNYHKWVDKPNMCHHKTEVDYTHTPDKMLKEENGIGSWFSAITGKGLALRTKAASRTNLALEAEIGSANGFLCSLGESIVGESSSGVRKSSSTPSLQDQDGNGGLSIWSASKWSLKPDLQAALMNPFFDGLPKPITGRRAKAALD